MLEYLQPLKVTQHRLGIAIGVPPRRINAIVHGTRRITTDTALGPARYFGTSERFWLNLQDRYDIEVNEVDSVLRSTRFSRSQPLERPAADRAQPLRDHCSGRLPAFAPVDPPPSHGERGRIYLGAGGQEMATASVERIDVVERNVTA